MADNDAPQQAPLARATVVIGDYELGAQIGRGSFATVYKGVNTRTGAAVAVKSVVRSSLTRRLLENLETEINILRTVRHHSIVELLDCLKSRNHIHLVMEYCSLGDLANYMRRTRDFAAVRNSHGGLHMGIARAFVFQLGEAMRFLRSRDIIHRDIKTQNILLQPRPPAAGYVLGESELRGDIPRIKVADFGFARNLPSTALAETLCGSPLYMAPEILHYEPYDAKADLWSIGAVVYEIMTGRPPFRANNHVELARVIERTNDNIVFPDERRAGDEVGQLQPQPQPLDPVLKDLVRGLLRMKPGDRLPFDAFFAHAALEEPAAPQGPLGPQADDWRGAPAASLPDAGPEPEPEPDAGRSLGLDGAGAVYNHHRHYVRQAYPPRERNSAGAHPADPQRDQGAEQHMSAALDALTLGDAAPRAGAYPPSPAANHPRRPQPQPQQSPQARRASAAGEVQAMAEPEYVVIEKRTVEMNVLADELESSPRTPLAFYPPRPGAIRQAPGVARQMTALARAIHNAVSPQYNISAEAANGPLSAAQGLPPTAAAAAAGGADRRHGVFNPLDPALAETFESRFSQGTPQEDPTIRRMEGLAYKAFAMSYLADIKWRMLPGAAPSRDPLVDPAAGFLRPEDVPIEAAFVLYLRALALLHRAMIDASRYWAALHALPATGDGDGGSGAAAAGPAAGGPGSSSSGSSSGGGGTASSAQRQPVMVSAAFNSAVQWVRTKFNECLERAEALKQLAHGRELDNVAQVSVVQTLYEKALDLGKAAALRELKWLDPLDCDRAYQLAIWMLSAILETAGPSPGASPLQRDDPHHPADYEAIDPEDRTIVERFIASIVKRREALQRRLMESA
ncbi:Serine/threonine-protein kinase [Coemansia javaensis]|uniref:non-specific serine/threonine protein kinase n=1 Tax=Coemansia javaensis TaxID=2761396 RepID=A0A9W8LDT3_9FUNG|nr:Serine/threonine-protein kinase [Coemansia javaensis]